MIKGEKELQKVLNGLPGVYEKEIIKANVKSADPLIYKMHRLAPVGKTGELADSIGLIKKKGDVMVGPRRGGGFKGYHAHLVEFGTKTRETSNGANRGRMSKNPFVEKSWEQSKDEVLKKYTVELDRAGLKYMKGIL